MPIRASAINSVQKSCRILRSLTEPRVTRLSEIATEAGLNKVTTLRILEVLMALAKQRESIAHQHARIHMPSFHRGHRSGRTFGDHRIGG